MENDQEAYPSDGATALEHLTGPSRGTVTWLNGPALDLSLSANRLLRVSEPGIAPGLAIGAANGEILAHLQETDGTYEITAVEGQSVWVNGVQVTSQLLNHRDMIEFGETGPLSRFFLYHEHSPVRKMVTDILGDVFVYLRVSRQPVPVRVFRASSGLLRRLMKETTLLFRFMVLLAIIALATLAYQQGRLNVLLQERIESGASKLESFAVVVARTREEALTPSDLEALQQEFASRLSSNVERLELLEHRSEATARVIASSMDSVVFLQGSYGFQERSSRRMMRHVINREGLMVMSPMGQPLLSLSGDGPVAERKFTGTAFAVGNAGALVTNRHVALPWEKDAYVEAMATHDLEPVMIRYIAYMPGKTTSDTVDLVEVSEETDLAVLRIVDMREPIRGLMLADTIPVPGNEVIVMGYPTGLRSMLAQSGEDFIEELQKDEDIEFWSVAARLAEKKYIAPLASRGIVSQATESTIVYDADTTHGGSGGPVLDVNGKVVAVNAAILPEYGGSNLGIPIARVRELLKKAGLL